MSGSQATMAASRMIKYGKAPLQRLIHDYHRPNVTATAQLIKNAAESRVVHPFALEMPPFTGLGSSQTQNGLSPAFGFGAQERRTFQYPSVNPISPKSVGAAAVPAVDKSGVEARGRQIAIVDERNIDFDDDEDDVDSSGYSSNTDFDDAFSDGDDGDGDDE